MSANFYGLLNEIKKKFTFRLQKLEQRISKMKEDLAAAIEKAKNLAKEAAEDFNRQAKKTKAKVLRDAKKKIDHDLKRGVDDQKKSIEEAKELAANAGAEVVEKAKKMREEILKSDAEFQKEVYSKAKAASGKAMKVMEDAEGVPPAMTRQQAVVASVGRTEPGAQMGCCGWEQRTAW